MTESRKITGVHCLQIVDEKASGHFMKLCCFLLLTLITASVTSAQEFRATLNGQVTDPSQAGIGDAKVTAINTATNEKSQAVTRADGNYTIPFLVPGKYTVSAEKAGFKTTTRENIELRVADKVTVNLEMEVGQVTENVTVTGAPPLLEEATASRGGVIDNVRVTQLPLNGRNPVNFTNLTPGVIFNGTRSSHARSITATTSTSRSMAACSRPTISCWTANRITPSPIPLRTARAP